MQFIQMMMIGAKMHHKNQFFNKSIYISMTIWPILEFIGIYYAYKPFARATVYQQLGLSSEKEIFIYLLLGFIGMMAFHVLIQGAWRGAGEFRYNGTLEMMYLTPVNRLSILIGNCLGYLFGSLWMIAVFYAGMFYFYRDVLEGHWVQLIVGMCLLLVSAICWGVFLNSLFLYSRDSGFLYTVFQTPVDMFTGARIPFGLMPIWAKAFGYCIPLTYVIRIIREMVLGNGTEQVLMSNGLATMAVCLSLIALSYVIMKLSEKNAAINGNATLF